MALPPGPREPPALQTVRWLTRPIALMEDSRRRFGDAFSLNFVGFRTPLVMISDPSAIRALYASPENGLPPGRTFALRPLLGPRSVLLLEGRDHLQRRRVMLPPSTATGCAPTRMSSVRSSTARSTPAHPRPGLQFAALLARGLGGPAPPERIRGYVAPVDDVLRAEIASRRADPRIAERSDILSLLISARFADGSGMDDTELRDQLITLVVAGHETTVTGLAWTFDLLLRHHTILDRLADEPEDPAGAYLRAVVAESLRLRPVIPLAGRRLHAPLQTNQLDLPPGTDVTPSIWLTHTRPDAYPELYSFRPERFLASPPDTYSWIPFGGGVRRNVTLSPRHGTPVILIDRRPA